jgi:hypothetical protein
MTSTLGGPAIRTFLRIAERWALSEDEQCAMLDVSRDVLSEWRTHAPDWIGRNQVDRISHIFGIHAALGTLIPSAVFRDRWIRQPNGHTLFGGCAPIDRMRAGIAGLALVRAYLDGECEG